MFWNCLAYQKNVHICSKNSWYCRLLDAMVLNVRFRIYFGAISCCVCQIIRSILVTVGGCRSLTSEWDHAHLGRLQCYLEEVDYAEQYLPLEKRSSLLSANYKKISFADWVQIWRRSKVFGLSWDSPKHLRTTYEHVLN